MEKVDMNGESGGGYREAWRRSISSPEDFWLEAAAGIDLGPKDFAATSDGAVVDAKHFYRKMQAKRAVSQRTNEKPRVQALHATIANRRKDFHHTLSAHLVRVMARSSLAT